MTRLLFLDHTAALGGAELSLLDIARGFRETSAVALFEDGPFVGKLEDAGVAVSVLPAPSGFTRVSRDAGLGARLAGLAGLVGLILRVSRMARSCDAVYTNSHKSLIVGALAARLASRPVIAHFREIVSDPGFGGSNRRLVVWLVNHMVTGVIANSAATKAGLVESGGRSDRVAVVLNGIDPAPFAVQEPGERDRLRRELGLGPGPVIGVFSRLSPWKGQHVLLEALESLPGVQALVVGDALFGEEEYAARLRRMATRDGLRERVFFAGFRDDIPGLLRAVDIVAHTSTAPEPFGRVLVEGMLARRPVIAAGAGGPLEIIENGVSGLLVPPGDSAALAEAVRELLDDPARARAIADAGYRRAKANFTISAMLAGIHREVDAALAGQAGAS